MIILSATHNSKIYSLLTGNILGIEELVERATINDTLDVDRLFTLLQSDRNCPSVDFVSLEEVSNNIGNITSFVLKVGTIKEVSEKYLLICKEE